VRTDGGIAFSATLFFILSFIQLVLIKIMIECYEVVNSNTAANDSVSLTYEQRQKSRGRAVTHSGVDVAWFLPRANVLADGEAIAAKDGTIVKIIAAPETLSEIICDDPLLLARAAYHLGNRHVPLQIELNSLCYQHDHVLDAMVEGLGLKVNCVQKPFHPESGAYHSHGHSHKNSSAHQHDHSHYHDHSQNHEHDHSHHHEH